MGKDFLVDQLQELNLGPGKPTFDKDNDIINVVIVGRSGMGKSATGNMMLDRGEEVFDEAPEIHLDPKTVKFQTEMLELDGIKLQITDTPGIFDQGNKAWWKFYDDIKKTVDHLEKKAHVFLYVASLEAPFCPHTLTTFKVSVSSWEETFTGRQHKIGLDR